jgi:hypothetical protein
VVVVAASFLDHSAERYIDTFVYLRRFGHRKNPGIIHQDIEWTHSPVCLADQVIDVLSGCQIGGDTHS